MKGGKRIGAGRKPVENKKVQIYFSVTLQQKNDKDFINFIKKQIENYGIRQEKNIRTSKGGKRNFII